jgi:phenylpyruvate tautomerase PptA (4-oxalocrotonate tautomerase family)
MPLVRISAGPGRSDSDLASIADGVHRGLIDSIGIPEGDRFQIIDRHGPGELVFDRHYLGIERQDVVFIQITLVAGRSDERKKRLYQEIVRNLEADPGVRPEDVVVTLTENNRIDWSVGNGVAQLVQDAG